MAIFIGIVIAVIAIFAYGGWLTMLTLGVLYSLFGILAPIGFWPSVGLFFLIQAFLGLLTVGSRRSK